MRLDRRPLGSTGLLASRLGLAAMGVRGRPHPAPGLTADDVELAYHEFGINTFLVHPMMKAMCEGVRRLIHDGYRRDIVLVSEVGLPFAGSVRRGLMHLLATLGTDRLDVWLIGWVRSAWYVRAMVWAEMDRLKRHGFTHAIGISSHDRPLAASLARSLPVDVLMIRYNAAHRGAEREVFAPLAGPGEGRPGIIAYTATRWGMLLDPVPARGFPTPLTAPECYRFVLGHPQVDMAWCAARSAAELREDVTGVLEGPLPEDRQEHARAFGDAVHAAARGGRRWMFGAGAG